MRTLLLLAALTACVAAADDVRLMPADAPERGWRFDDGAEFPGATGGLVVDAEAKHDGAATLRLDGDFTGGGNYVQIMRSLDQPVDPRALSLWLRAPGMTGFTLRLIDGSGQCHQIVVALDGAANEWRLVDLPIERFFAERGTPEAPTIVTRYENWGGANDGRWHAPLEAVALLVGPGADKRARMWLSGLTVVRRTAGGADAWRCTFDDAEALKAWTTRGDVARDTSAFAGAGALTLKRDASARERPCDATGPAFVAAPGPCEAACALRAALESPDNSYRGVVELACLDAAGKEIARLEVADAAGARAWRMATRRLELPPATASARFVARLDKCVGAFSLDELALTPLARAPHRVARIRFDSARLGNLLDPGDARSFAIELLADEPLADGAALDLVVRDYWGAEIAPPLSAALTRDGADGKRARYRAGIDLAALPLEIGRYYELRASIADGAEAFAHSTSFAIRPEPSTKRHRPEEIPFTARSWDNRIPEYFQLADRIGVRVAGVWGGWSCDAPYKPQAPSIEWCDKLGMGVVTGSPISLIESHAPGWEKVDERAIRQGVRNWIATFGARRPLIIDPGNEPNVGGERLQETVRAYRALYEEVKAIDPSITVLATSVPPREDYFAAGYWRWCDAFDFHVYETPEAVRASIAGYRRLMAKYGCPDKPIWSTEIGLNSQGLPRETVAIDVIRKLTTFFACGGADVGWFGYMYPDGDGTAFGGSGDSHNVFDCRFGRYAPKLDAIALADFVDALCVKRFVGEKTYEGGVYGALFRDRDGESLAVWWSGGEARDAFVAMPGAHAVELVRIDGRRRALDAHGAGLTLGIGRDPLLLRWRGDAGLPATLAGPRASIASAPRTVLRGAPATLSLALHGVAADAIALEAPAGWTVAAAKDASWTLTPPATTEAREGEVLIGFADHAGELAWRPAVGGRLALAVLPARVDGEPAAKLVLRNRSGERQEATWSLALTTQRTPKDGVYQAPTASAAYFAAAANGSLAVQPQGEAAVTVPIAGADPLAVYAVHATATDATGRALALDRPLAGFALVPKATNAPTLDGALDEAEWARCAPLALDRREQFRALGARTWKGPDDLSATLRFLWDERCLYVGVAVIDDRHVNTKRDGDLWAGDGLQFLIDPARASDEKTGTYDYGMALGAAGPQAWCFGSADPRAPSGAAPDIVVAAKPGAAGAMTYELAIPWTRLAPFAPAAGADLGLTMIVNEDDGAGRAGFIGWFGDAHEKLIDQVGDLILDGR